MRHLVSVPVRSALALASLGVAPVLGQATVPGYAAVLEGERAASLHLLLAGSVRYQQVFTAAAVAPRSASITAMSWRRDGRITDPIPVDLLNRTRTPSWRMARVDLELSHTRSAPRSMNRELGKNVTATPTRVFSAAWNFPSLGPPTSIPAPGFDIRFPFRQPYSYLAASGNLLADFQFGLGLGSGPGGAWNSVPPYPVDAVGWSAPGWYGSFGKIGRSMTTDRTGPGLGPRTAVGTSLYAQLRPGGAYDVQVAIATASAPDPVFLWTGLSQRQSPWGPLPLELTRWGAAGNFLHVRPDLVSGVKPTARRLLFGWGASFPIRIPADPGLRGLTVFHQAALADRGANRLGVLTSPGLLVQLGGAPGVPQTHALVSLLSLPVGVELIGRRGGIGGPVTRFDGTFR